MRRAAALALLTILGCSDATPIRSADGRVLGFRLQCPGDMKLCTADARERCPDGYQVVEQSVDQTKPADRRGTLIIRCKGRVRPERQCVQPCSPEVV